MVGKKKGERRKEEWEERMTVCIRERGRQMDAMVVAGDGEDGL